MWMTDAEKPPDLHIIAAFQNQVYILKYEIFKSVMQILEFSVFVRVHIKTIQYPENFFLILRIFELFFREVCKFL